MRHFPGRGSRALVAGTSGAPGSWTGRRERVKSPSSFLRLGPEGRTSPFLRRGRRTTPRAPRGRRWPPPPALRSRCGRRARLGQALGGWAGKGLWAGAVSGGGADSYRGDQLSPERSGPPGFDAILFRKGLRELFEWKITKTKRGLAEASPPLVATAQLTAPPPTVPVPPSLLPSFQAASLTGLLPRLPSYESITVKSPLRLFLWPLSQPAPLIRPWGSSAAPGQGTPQTNSASPESPSSLSSSGHLCCPLERGPLSMGLWDFFFFLCINSIFMVSIPSKDCIISESYFLIMSKILMF